MRAPTGFHADQAGLEIREEAHHILALELLAQSHFPMLVDSMHLKNHFCQIDPNRRNLHGDAPSQVVGLHLHFGTSMPVEKGGVHTINTRVIEIPIRNSTLSHHLEKLKNENLVKVRREGTFLRYSANAAALQRLLTPALMSGLNRLRQVGSASTLPKLVSVHCFP